MLLANQFIGWTDYSVRRIVPRKSHPALSKNENVNWLKYCLIIQASSVRTQCLHSSCKLAWT